MPQCLALRRPCGGALLRLFRVAGAASGDRRAPGCAKRIARAVLHTRLNECIHLATPTPACLLSAPIPSPSANALGSAGGHCCPSESSRKALWRESCARIRAPPCGSLLYRARQYKEVATAERAAATATATIRRPLSCSPLTSSRFFPFSHARPPPPKPPKRNRPPAPLLRRQDRLGPGLRKWPPAPRRPRRPQARHRRPRAQVHDRRLRRC